MLSAYEFTQYQPRDSSLRVPESVFGDFHLSFCSNPAFSLQGFSDLADGVLPHTSCPQVNLSLTDFEGVTLATPANGTVQGGCGEVGLSSKDPGSSCRDGFSTSVLPLNSCAFPEQLAGTFQAAMVTCSDSSQSRDFLYADNIMDCGAESYDSRMSAPLQDSDAVLAELFFAPCGGSKSNADTSELDTSSSGEDLDVSGCSGDDMLCTGPAGNNPTAESPCGNASQSHVDQDFNAGSVPSLSSSTSPKAATESAGPLIKREELVNAPTVFLMPFAPPALLAQAFSFPADVMPALKLPQTAIADIQAKALGMKNFVPEHYGQTLTSSIIEQLQRFQQPSSSAYPVVPTCTPSDTESFEEDKEDSANTVLEVPTMEIHDAARLSIEVPMTRQQRIDRYRKKKQRRLFALNMVRYQLRKVCAENRPRIKGRFVTKVQLQQAADDIVVME